MELNDVVLYKNQGLAIYGSVIKVSPCRIQWIDDFVTELDSITNVTVVCPADNFDSPEASLDYANILQQLNAPIAWESNLPF